MPPVPPDQLGVRTGEDRFLTTRQVRARYGDASEMWIWRRLQDTSGFPKPMEICGRRFWKLSDLIVWERSRCRDVT